jgi:hypothetical protein
MQVLQKHLLARHAAGKQVVIFVEEAQGMPLATLEEIRLLSNLETKHDKLLQIVLFGQPELDENLNQVNIRQLRERITHSFNLAPLQTKEIGEYLIFRLRAAGYFGPHLFSKAAISKIAASAEGLVRRVNILADKSLLAAFADNEYQVTPKHVQAAIGDSEFGVEASKKQAKKSQMLMLCALLVLALALGFAMSMWANKSSNLESTNFEQTNLSQQASALVKSAPASATVVANAKPAVTLPAAPAAAPVAAPAPETTPAPVTPIATSVTAMASTASPSVALPTVATTTPETIVAPSPAMAATSPPEDILTRRLNATSAWLTSQAPTTVSIQLMGASSDEQIKTDLEKLSGQLEIDNIYVYRTEVNNLPFLSVLYGSFADRIAATQALKNLPSEIQKNRPHLRTIAGVLQETK